MVDEPPPGELPFDGPSVTFLEDLDFDYEIDETGLRGSMRVTETMLTPGSEQAAIAVLASVADVITGIPISSRQPRTVGLTVDLVLRVLRPIGLGTYPIRSRVTKPGRTVSVTEAEILIDGAIAAHCFATFIPFVLLGDQPLEVSGRRIGRGSHLGRPFAEALGVIIERPGVASVERRPYTLQPAGTIQGGVVCSLIETAAWSLLGSPLLDIDIRFLSRINIGPGRAVAEQLDARTARITVTDAGSSDPRLAAVAIART